MTKLKSLGIGLLILASASLEVFAQTNNAVTNTPIPTIQGGLQQIVDAVNSTNIYASLYYMHAASLPIHGGGGVGIFVPLSTYVVMGTRVDYVNGGFWMPSGNAAFQIPITIFHRITITPLGYAGIGVPVSGAKFGGFTIPGNGKDNNGQATAITGYGFAIGLTHFNIKSTKVSLDVVADREQWSGFPGWQYRVGLAGHMLF